jgi:long-chain fatty acid transport protein
MKMTARFMERKSIRAACAGFVAVFCAASSIAHANGIGDNGFGPRSISMGGADVAWANDPMGAMGANPAGLGFIPDRQLTLGGIGGILQGHYTRSESASTGSLDNSPVGLPDGAFVAPIKDSPVTLGFSCMPESSLLAKWNYRDSPGGIGGNLSYGYQDSESELLELRTAFGAAVKVTSDFSVGASVGLIYNDNRLIAPYIFQNLQPGANSAQGNQGFSGAKTLLNLHTTGWGWNAQVGFIYKITPDLQVGASYESPTTIISSGDATGDASLQFGAPPGTLNFRYDAQVTNTFPQEVRAGISWKFQPQWRAAVQVDWIDWADAFHNLPMTFRNGSDSAVNAALGSSFSDSVPLDWKSEFVYRVGFEYDVTKNLTLRAGYCYGSNPVPDATLTPLTAAIMEHTFTCGAGYHWDRYEVDLGYQYDLPATQSVGQSGLRAGEFSNSTVEVSAHELALSATMHF